MTREPLGWSCDRDEAPRSARVKVGVMAGSDSKAPGVSARRTHREGASGARGAKLRVSWPVALAITATLVAAWHVTSHSRGRKPEPSWTAVTLFIPELDCGFWCGVKVSSALEEMNSVYPERLDPDLGLLTVRFDPLRTGVEAIVAALRRRGITVQHEPLTDR